MPQTHQLTYTCPKCSTTFSKPCVFASNSSEYDTIKKQLPTPFGEDSEKRMCFNQAECPNRNCDEKRHYPILIEGSLG